MTECRFVTFGLVQCSKMVNEHLCSTVLCYAFIGLTMSVGITKHCEGCLACEVMFQQLQRLLEDLSEWKCAGAKYTGPQQPGPSQSLIWPSPARKEPQSSTALPDSAHDVKTVTSRMALTLLLCAVDAGQVP